MNSTNDLKTQNKQLHALLAKLGIDKEGKEALVWQYTEERTCHSSQMYSGERSALIGFLRKQLTKSVPAKSESRDKLLKKLKHLAALACGYAVGDQVDWSNKVIPYLIKVCKQADWASICALPIKSLIKLVSVMEKVVNHKEGKKADDLVGNLKNELGL